MKLSNVVNLLLVSVTASAFFQSNVLDQWDATDLKDYLKDNSIPFDEKKTTIEEIKDLSRKQWELQHKRKTDRAWYHPQELKQQVLNAYDTNIGGISRKKNDNGYSNIKDWVFNTWSAKEIKRLLDTSKIEYSADSSRSELVQAAQDNYDKIAKYFNKSGKYPGDWLYTGWEKKDLKKWLKDHDIDYSTFRDSREDLARKVREHAYTVSNYAQDQRDDVLESLNLGEKNIFDKAGDVRDDVFNTWTSSQLYKWLKSHKIDFEDSLKSNKEELALVAQKNKKEFKKDVDSFLSKASKSSSPFLSKATDKVDNVINDTFFVGIESWSRDRLKAFLESRGVRVPRFATKYELINLVKENKYKPIKNFNSDSFFQGWSKENIQKWVEEQGDSASKTSKDLLSKANDLYKSFAASVADAYENVVSNAQETASQVQEGATKAADKAVKETTNAKDKFFEYWSDVELRNYLESFGVYNTKSYSHNDLLRLAKKNTNWFVSGAQHDAQAKFKELKLSGESWWNSVRYYWYKFYYYLRLNVFHW